MLTHTHTHTHTHRHTYTHPNRKTHTRAGAHTPTYTHTHVHDLHLLFVHCIFEIQNIRNKTPATRSFTRKRTWIYYFSIAPKLIIVTCNYGFEYGRILEVMIAVLHFIMLVFRQVASCKWSSNYLWHLRKPKNRGGKHLKPKNSMHFYACTANRWLVSKPKNRRKVMQKPKNRPKKGPKPQNRKQVDPPCSWRDEWYLICWV